MKRVIAAALVMLLLVGLTSTLASTPGSAADPLISLSYINNTFAPSTLGDSKQQVSNTLGALYDNAEAQVQAAYDAYMLSVSGYTGYTFAAEYTPLSLSTGKKAELVTGATFILTSGKAGVTFQGGTVINISTGDVVSSGDSLTVNERYFCAENTVAVFTAAAGATCQIDGYYKTTGSVIVNPNNFLDVGSNDWFYESVIFARDNGLFNGTSDTAFSPEDSMTRAMFVTVLYRLAGKPAVYAESEFADVAAKSLYYYDPVVWANANNIVTGYDGKFHPDDKITREQMAVIIYRYADFAGHNTSIAGADGFDAFPDSGATSAYAVESMKWATLNGVINGSDGKLLPKNTASRAQVAQIIMNFCQAFLSL